MEGAKKLEIAGVVLGFICFALLMILMVMHSAEQQNDDIITFSSSDIRFSFPVDQCHLIEAVKPLSNLVPVG